MKSITVAELRQAVQNQPAKSAWDKGVKEYAMKFEIIVDDGINQWTYYSNSRDVKKLAMEYGHARAGETITVYNGATSKPLSRAVWDAESRKYIRVLVEK